jgi:hypothetical protein
LAKRHGAYASQARLTGDERTAQLHDEIVLTQPVFAPADDGVCWRLAICYRRIELASAAIERAADGVAKHKKLDQDRARALAFEYVTEEEVVALIGDYMTEDRGPEVAAVYAVVSLLMDRLTFDEGQAEA